MDLRRRLLFSASIALLTVARLECYSGNVSEGSQVALLLAELGSTAGQGSQMISNPAAIQCGTDCTALFPQGTQVQLIAQPLSGYHLASWSGACSGSDSTCTVTMTDTQNVSFMFTADQPPPLPAPTLTGVSPGSALNNAMTALTLTGTGFRPGAMVTVGGAACTNVGVTSATQLTCTVQAKAATCGPQAVVVTNSDKQAAMGSLFSYRPPSVAFGATTNQTDTVGINQSQVITADFNGDGKLDLATANFGSNNVSIFLNNGMGGFGAATNFAVGTGPRAIAVGDLNKDNKLDLVVSNTGSNNISFLAGNGMGGFATAVNTAGFSSPVGVAIGDINNDMNPDVVIANFNMANVAVLTGNGTGALAMGTAVSVGNNPYYLALADLNKDGYLDIVAPNAGSNNISYRPGNGMAGFGAGMDIAVGMFPVFVVAKDVNGDKSLDLLVANLSSNNVTVLLGNGAGTFNAAAGSPFSVGATPQTIGVVDIDGDGKLDLLSANFNSNNLSILAGNGMGGFANIPGSPFAAPGNPWAIVAADFNGDGLMDVANANQNSNNTAVRLAMCN